MRDKNRLCCARHAAEHRISLRLIGEAACVLKRNDAVSYRCNVSFRKFDLSVKNVIIRGMQRYIPLFVLFSFLIEVMNPSTAFVRAEVDPVDSNNRLTWEHDRNLAGSQEIEESSALSLTAHLKMKVTASHSAAFFLLPQIKVSPSSQVKIAKHISSLPQGNRLEIYRPPVSRS